MRLIAPQCIVAMLAIALISSADAETAFNQINFDLNSSVLRPDAIAILHEGAELMVRNPELHARIEGSACASEDRSNELWFERAIAARTFLVQHGVNPSQIVAVAAVTPRRQADMNSTDNVPCSERVRAVLFVDARIPY